MLYYRPIHIIFLTIYYEGNSTSKSYYSPLANIFCNAVCKSYQPVSNELLPSGAWVKVHQRSIYYRARCLYRLYFFLANVFVEEEEEEEEEEV